MRCAPGPAGPHPARDRRRLPVSWTFRAPLTEVLLCCFPPPVCPFSWCPCPCVMGQERAGLAATGRKRKEGGGGRQRSASSTCAYGHSTFGGRSNRRRFARPSRRCCCAALPPSLPFRSAGALAWVSRCVPDPAGAHPAGRGEREAGGGRQRATDREERARRKKATRLGQPYG